MGVQEETRGWGCELAVGPRHAAGSPTNGPHIHVRLECKLLCPCTRANAARPCRYAARSHRRGSRFANATHHLYRLLFWRAYPSRGMSLDTYLPTYPKWMAGQAANLPRRSIERPRKAAPTDIFCFPPSASCFSPLHSRVAMLRSRLGGRCWLAASWESRPPTSS